MDVLTLEGFDPCTNLATEEYLLLDEQRTDDILLLWRNDNTIVLGRHQLAVQEVNPDFVQERGITVVRRITGGGAVYHDLGNVNFSFITRANNAENITLERFTKPVARALRSLGLNAETTGRNDIAVDGLKVSGNAQSLFRSRLLHHGTLLFDTDLSILGQALKPHPAKLSSRGIRSVSSRVTNIQSQLPKPMPVEDFIKIIMAALSAEDAKPLVLDQAAKRAIDALRSSKYATHAWNIGRAPTASLINTRKFRGGLLEVRMDIISGHMENCVFFGDFMAMVPAESLAAQLNGVLYNREAVREVLQKIDLVPYMGSIMHEEVLNCLFDLSMNDE